MGLTAFNRMRREREAALRKAEKERTAASTSAQQDDPGLKENKLRQMKKEDLAEYGLKLGLDLPPELTKNQMIEAIQECEAEMEQ